MASQGLVTIATTRMRPHPSLLTPLLRDLLLVYRITIFWICNNHCFLPFFAEEIYCAEIQIDRKEYLFRFHYVVVWIVNPATTNSIPRRQ